jgi:hypothetical protein
MTVPAYGLGVFVGNIPFLEASWIPHLKQPKLYALATLQVRFRQYPVCENIRNGYLYDGDLVFVILKGIYCFKFPKRFLEISSRDLTSSFLFCQS